MKNDALFTRDTLIDCGSLEDVNKLLMLQDQIAFSWLSGELNDGLAIFSPSCAHVCVGQCSRVAAVWLFRFQLKGLLVFAILNLNLANVRAYSGMRSGDGSGGGMRSHDGD